MAGTRNDIGFGFLLLESTYQGATTGTTYIPAMLENPGVGGLDVEMAEDTSIRSSIFDRGDAPKSGLRTGTLKIAVDAGGMGTPAASTIATNGDTTILQYAIGARISTAKGHKISGTGGTVTKFAVSAITGITTGLGITVLNEATFVNRVSGKYVFVWPPLRTAPTTASTQVYVGDTYYPADSTRRTFRIEYHEEANKLGYRALGCHLIPSWSNLGAGQSKAKLTLDAAVGDWAPVATQIAAAAAPNCFTNQGVIQDDGWFILSDGTNSITAGVSAFEVANLLQGTNNKDISGPNCKGTPKLVKSAGEITVTVYQPDNSDDPINILRTWVSSRTTLKCFYQAGKTAGDIIAWHFPAVYIASYPKETNVEGLIGITFKMNVTLPRTATGINRVPFRFARL